MTDDPTTREAVGRVRLDLELRARHYAHPDYEQETTEGAFSWAEVRAVMNALDRVTRERDVLRKDLVGALAALDAATTAERDRIRNAVAGMMRTHPFTECPSCTEMHSCSKGLRVLTHNAALADVARIIDAEGV